MELSPKMLAEQLIMPTQEVANFALKVAYEGIGLSAKLSLLALGEKIETGTTNIQPDTTKCTGLVCPELSISSTECHLEPLTLPLLYDAEQQVAERLGIQLVPYECAVD